VSILYPKGEVLANPYPKGEVLANPYPKGEVLTNPYPKGEVLANPKGTINHGIMGKPMISSYINRQRLIHTKAAVAQRGKVGAHQGLAFGNHLFCLAFYHSRRASLTRARGTCGAFCGRRAFHLRAARARAGWALSLWLLALRAVQNDWVLLGDGRLQHIIAQIGDGWALTLQNIVAEIGYCRARWDGTLQYIFTHVRLLAIRTRRTNGTRLWLIASTWGRLTATVALRPLTEPFIVHSFTEIEANGNAYDKNSYSMKYGHGHSVRNLLFK
jgi:hypothetical protein